MSSSWRWGSTYKHTVERDEAMGWTPHSKAVVFVLSFVLRKTITPMSLIIIIIILLLLFGGGGYAYRGSTEAEEAWVSSSSFCLFFT